jgi:hypothetical protein
MQWTFGIRQEYEGMDDSAEQRSCDHERSSQLTAAAHHQPQQEHPDEQPEDPLPVVARAEVRQRDLAGEGDPDITA